MLTVKGVQCHIAYPERGRNPIHMAMPALAELAATEWDRGNEYFSPTSFQISHVHAGAGANNTIPGVAGRAVQLPLLDRVDRGAAEGARARRAGRDTVVEYELKWTLSGAPFLSPRGGLVDVLSAAVTRGDRRRRRRSRPAAAPRTAASSHAVSREVVEFGPVSASIHGIDEHVTLADIRPLSQVYERALTTLLRN